MSGALLAIVPSGDVRSIIRTDKGEDFVTVGGGKFRVVADVTTEGKVTISQELFDEVFEITEPDSAV